MLDIIGGTYYERCEEPRWDELYGSGLRAVSALSNQKTEIAFHTYADASVREHLRNITAGSAVTLELHAIPRNVKFDYYHPLSNPSFAPPSNQFEFLEPILVENSECAIVYGMIEKNAVIKGDKVVYDPQSPANPQAFTRNGSSAKTLVVLLNHTEATAMCGSSDVSYISKYFFLSQNAHAVIIKHGPEGALLLQPDKEAILIPPFITDHVWSIGSGDIFTAIFGYKWMVEKLDLEEAAHCASLSTAYYVNSAALPIPKNIGKRFNQFIKRTGEGGKIYLAGPFFTISQRWLISEIKSSLEKLEMEVFSPLHHVGYGAPGMVAELDLAGLNSCNLIFAIGDGLDTGTIFEIGYAVSKGIPVVLYLEREDPQSMTMLIGTGCKIETDLTTAIFKAYWQLNQ